ncbi:hypothetical protein ACVIGA_000013 [Bradyrhizobium sp. USDA 3240]
MPNLIYATGTVAIGAGAVSVASAGGPLWASNVQQFDKLIVDGFAGVDILGVTDDTHLVIAKWPFAAVPAGTKYQILQTSPLRFNGAQNSAEVIRLTGALEADGFYIFVRADQAGPDPSKGDEGQYARQPATGKEWYKSGGVWTFVGVSKPLGDPAPYDNARVYSLMDVATANGSSYVWINAAPGSGHAPPDPTYWVLLASKGDTGATGPLPWLHTAAWATGQNYVVGPPASIVVHQINKNIYQCIVPHLSGNFATDLAAGKWLLIGQSATEATSATALAIGTGTKVFSAVTGFSYQNGVRLRASSNASPTSWMEGVCLYDPVAQTITMTVDKANGVGTFGDWNFNRVGQPGAGDLSSTNNLSDLPNKADARINLGANIASGRYNVLSQDGLIDNTGATNASTRMLAALTAIWNSGSRAYVPPGTYNMGSAQINLPDYMSVEAHPGAIIRRTADQANWDASGPLIRIGSRGTWSGGQLDNTSIYATSNTSNTINSSGPKSFTLPSVLPFPASFARFTSRANRSNYMEGVVTVAGNVVTLGSGTNPIFFNGSGTFADWDICQGNIYQAAAVMSNSMHSVLERVQMTGYFYVGAIMDGWNAPGGSANFCQNNVFSEVKALAILNRPFYLYGSHYDHKLEKLFVDGSKISDYGVNINPGNGTGTSNLIRRVKVFNSSVINSLAQGFTVAENCIENEFNNCSAVGIANSLGTSGAGFLQTIANSGSVPIGNIYIGCQSFACYFGYIADGATSGLYSGCLSRASIGAGYYIGASQATQLVNWTGCRSEGSGGAGYYVGPNSVRLDFDGTAAIGNAGYGYTLATGSTLNHVNGRAYNNVGPSQDLGTGNDVTLRST